MQAGQKDKNICCRALKVNVGDHRPTLLGVQSRPNLSEVFPLHRVGQFGNHDGGRTRVSLVVDLPAVRKEKDALKSRHQKRERLCISKSLLSLLFLSSSLSSLHFTVLLSHSHSLPLNLLNTQTPSITMDKVSLPNRRFSLSIATRFTDVDFSIHLPLL